MVPYGTISAVEISLTDVMDKVVVDDWGQASAGRFGALRRHVDEGLLTRETLHAEIGDIVAVHAPGRERPEERILFWHRVWRRRTRPGLLIYSAPKMPARGRHRRPDTAGKDCGA